MTRWTITSLTALSLLACEEPALLSVPTDEPANEASVGDATRGRALLARYECNRCHDGTGLEAPPIERQCVGCHRAIARGDFDAPPETLARWQAHLTSLPEAPSLAGVSRFRTEWLIGYLQEPRDLRPHLLATMPRLGIDERDARDLVAALTEGGSGRDVRAPPSAALPPAPSRAREGEAIARSAGCGGCHTFGGEPIGSAVPRTGRAFVLAPDLAVARERLDEATLLAWLRDPRSVHAETPMPPTGLDASEAAAVARWILDADRPARDVEVPARLPLLERDVQYAEVEARILRRVCWHCHSDPSFARGDGGPGNSGGFGFAGRRLDLSSYQGLRSGAIGDDGARHSVFELYEMPDGTALPRIVAILRARQLEEAGRPVPGVRGMPLGFPSVSPEDLQLLETWIAQGRRR